MPYEREWEMKFSCDIFVIIQFTPQTCLVIVSTNAYKELCLYNMPPVIILLIKLPENRVTDEKTCKMERIKDNVFLPEGYSSDYFETMCVLVLLPPFYLFTSPILYLWMYSMTSTL